MSSNCGHESNMMDEHQNGHQKTRVEVRNQALELNRKRNQLENEIKEFPIGPIIFLPNVYFLIR